MSVAATAPQQTESTKPAVLVVGFDVGDITRKRYEGRALFDEDPEKYKKPNDLPSDTKKIILRSGLDERVKRRIINLAGARQDVSTQEIGSLPPLQDALEAIFEPIPDEGKPDEGLVKIRAIETTAGTVVDWVRQNIRYPFPDDKQSKEIRRLCELRLSADAAVRQASEGAVGQAVYSLLDKAGIRPRGSGRGATTKPEVDSNALVPRLLTVIQSAIDESNSFHNTHVAKLRDLQMQLKSIQGDSIIAERLRVTNAELRTQLQAASDRADTAERRLDDFLAGVNRLAEKQKK